MKRDTARPQDKADAEALKQRFDIEDDPNEDRDRLVAERIKRLRQPAVG